MVSLRILADENLNNNILRGLQRRIPDLSLTRVQDQDLSGADDATVLAWAAEQGCVVLTHDVSTMTKQAIARVKAGLPMPGLVEVSQFAPLGQVIEDLALLVICSHETEWEGQILYLPFPI